MRRVALLVVAISLVAAGQSWAKTRTTPTEGTMWIAGGEPDYLDKVLPLERTDVFAEVTGFMGRVRVRQTFNNPYDKPIEAIYVFPLPNEAAVSDMTITIGDRVVRAKIEKREEARKIYERAKQAGKATALLEQERPNIFTQSVANIAPGEEILVEIVYDQLLRYDDGNYELVYPMVVGPRYVPSEQQVPDAKRITPPTLKPGERRGHDIDLKVALDPGMTVTGLESTTHTVDVSPESARTRASDGRITVSLAGGDTIPNKDFVLRFKVAGDKPKMAVVAHRGEQDGYFAFMFQPPARPAREDVMPKEIVFVLDVSGSMSGEPIALVKRAMRHAIKHLNPDDSFRIVTFSGSASSMTDRALANTPKNVRGALSFINGIDTGGGTQMLAGVEAALDAPSADRLRIVLFMSDGYVGNETEILDAIERKLGANTRVFPFGVGSSVNRYLLERMADVGRGHAAYMLLDEDPAAQVEEFYARFADPVLTNIDVDWADLDVSDMTPAAVPDVFAGQPIWIVGRYGKGGKDTVRVRGKLGGRDVSYDVPVRLPRASKHNAALAQLWARQQVKALMARMYGGEDPELVGRVTRLGLDYRIATKYTSFVAVDERVVNEGGRVETIEVPVEMPEGVSYDAVFGEDEQDADGSMRQISATSAGAPGVDYAAEAISAAARGFEPSRWRFGLAFAYGGGDVGGEESGAASLWTFRLTRTITPRLGLGAQLSLALPRDSDLLWTNVLLETIYLPMARIALIAGLGGALPNDGDVGLGYHFGTQFRLFQFRRVEVGLDLRLDGAVYFDEDTNSPNTVSGGLNFSF